MRVAQFGHELLPQRGAAVVAQLGAGGPVVLHERGGGFGAAAARPPAGQVPLDLSGLITV